MIERVRCITRNMSINQNSYIYLYFEEWDKVYRSKIFDTLIVRI